MKVLVVDDSKAVFTLVSQMLEKEGHQPFWAKDGQEAREFLEKNQEIELVLLDWIMPIMDGLTFLKVNQNEKVTDAPIVMMTTNNKPEHIREALENGASEYIMKPFTPEVLRDKMELVFG